jgi:hypothetical protein
MKRAKFLILAVIFSSAVATAQSQPQASTGAGASASSSTSANASRQDGVQAGSSSSGTLSAKHDGSGSGSTAEGTSLAGGSSASIGKDGAQLENSTVNSASATNSRGPATGAAGSATMNAALTHPVDAKKNRPGDPVNARTTRASQSPDGTPLPKGTQLVGHVTQAQSRGKNQSESDLGIVFDKAVLKNGQEVPMNGTIQAIAAARNTASTADNLDDADLGGSVAGGGLARGGLVGSGGAEPGRAGFVGGGNGALGVGGASSGLGKTVGPATAPVSSVGSGAHGAVGSAAGTAGTMTRGATGGLNTAGELTSNSQGVFNMQGLNLATAATSASSATGAAQGSLLTSGTRNVHLDSGTQLLVSATNAAQLQASK